MSHEKRNMNDNNSNALQSVIRQAIEEMKSEQDDKFGFNKINLLNFNVVAVLMRARPRQIKRMDSK